jgi:hypothetical protein
MFKLKSVKNDTGLAPGLQSYKLRETQAGEPEQERVMKKKQKFKKLKSLPVFILAVMTASSCGGSATTFTNPINSGGTASPYTYPTTTTPTTTSTSTTTTTTTNSQYPAENFSFSITGQGGATPTYSTYSNNGSYISTDNLLQVMVTPAAAGELTFPSTSTTQYSAFTASYNCITYTVSVYDSTGALLQSQTTGTLALTSGNSGCSSSPTSQTLDFSSVVVSGSHNGVYVTVSADNYDFYCQYWYSLYDAYGTASPWYADYSSFCPMRAVYKTHTVNGSLSVITNGSGG